MNFEPPKSPWQYSYDEILAQALADRRITPVTNETEDAIVAALQAMENDHAT
jgi:hypothetical protein